MGDRWQVDKPPQFETSHPDPGQLSLATPSWVDKMDTNESRYTARCTSNGPAV